MTSYTQHVADYLQLRRSLGYKLHEHARLLRRFAVHLDATDAEFVTVDLALAWALEPKATTNVNPRPRAQEMQQAIGIKRLLDARQQHRKDPKAPLPRRPVDRDRDLPGLPRPKVIGPDEDRTGRGSTRDRQGDVTRTRGVSRSLG